MNGAQIHLILNHVPIFATIGGILLLAWARLRASPEVSRVALVLLVLAGLAVVPVYLSGEPAEERVEHAVGISKESIEQHEDAAKVSLVLIAITGLTALTGLVMQRRRPNLGWLAVGIFGFGLLTAMQIAWTAHLGGSIRHPELTGSATAASQTTSEEDVEHD